MHPHTAKPDPEPAATIMVFANRAPYRANNKGQQHHLKGNGAAAFSILQMCFSTFECLCHVFIFIYTFFDDSSLAQRMWSYFTVFSSFELPNLNISDKFKFCFFQVVHAVLTRQPGHIVHRRAVGRLFLSFLFLVALRPHRTTNCAQQTERSCPKGALRTQVGKSNLPRQLLWSATLK